MARRTYFTTIFLFDSKHNIALLMKIIFDFQSMGGGAPRSQYAHLCHVKNHGHDVLATIGRDIETLRQLAPNLRICEIPNFTYFNVFANLAVARKWLKLLRTEKPDIVYANRPAQFIGLVIVADISGIPLVFAQAGAEANKRLIRFMRGNIAVVYSLENLQTFIETGFAKSDVHVISNRIPLKRKDVDIDDGSIKPPLKLLFVGNIKRETIKGVTWLINQIGKWGKSCQLPFEFHIAGKDVSHGQIYAKGLSKLIRNIEACLGNHGKIAWLGWVDEIEDLQLAHHICIGKGRSVIQAAMYGKTCFVLSEEGRLTRVCPDNFESLCMFNFSGRGPQRDDSEDIKTLLTEAPARNPFHADAVAAQSMVREAYLDEYAYPKLMQAYEAALQRNKPHFALWRRFLRLPGLGMALCKWGFDNARLRSGQER